MRKTVRIAIVLLLCVTPVTQARQGSVTEKIIAASVIGSFAAAFGAACWQQTVAGKLVTLEQEFNAYCKHYTPLKIDGMLSNSLNDTAQALALVLGRQKILAGFKKRIVAVTVEAINNSWNSQEKKNALLAQKESLAMAISTAQLVVQQCHEVLVKRADYVAAYEQYLSNRADEDSNITFFDLDYTLIPLNK